MLEVKSREGPKEALLLKETKTIFFFQFVCDSEAALVSVGFVETSAVDQDRR